MKTLLVYDLSGKIWVIATGDYESPKETMFRNIEVEIPDGYYAESVNPETGVPVLKKIPKTKEQQRLDELEAQVAALTGKEV